MARRLVALTRQVIDAIEASGLEYAVGGAFAYGFWAAPRGTSDIDVTIYVPEAAADRAMAVLRAAGCTFDEAAARCEAVERGQFKGTIEGYRVGVFLPTIPFYEEARGRRIRTSFEGSPVWIWSAEVLCVFKLLFFRTKDLVDIERMIADQPALGHAFVRRSLVEMVGESDERVRRWDELVRTFARG